MDDCLLPRHAWGITRFGSTHVNACGPNDAPPLVLRPGVAISSTMWYPKVADVSPSLRETQEREERHAIKLGSLTARGSENSRIWYKARYSCCEFHCEFLTTLG